MHAPTTAMIAERLLISASESCMVGVACTCHTGAGLVPGCLLAPLGPLLTLPAASQGLHSGTIPAMLQVADVSYGLPTRQLLRNVSFFLNRGEKVGLVGVNGAGKSTLLKIVVGELLPESGSVVCAGTVGYVPQSVPLDRTMSGMSVFEYVAEGRGLIRLQRELDHLTEEFEEAPTDQALEAYERVVTAFEAAGGWQARAAVGTLMARLGMGFLDLDSPFGALSGGQRARLAIGRA